MEVLDQIVSRSVDDAGKLAKLLSQHQEVIQVAHTELCALYRFLGTAPTPTESISRAKGDARAACTLANEQLGEVRQLDAQLATMTRKIQSARADLARDAPAAGGGKDATGIAAARRTATPSVSELRDVAQILERARDSLSLNGGTTGESGERGTHPMASPPHCVAERLRARIETPLLTEVCKWRVARVLASGSADERHRLTERLRHLRELQRKQREEPQRELHDHADLDRVKQSMQQLVDDCQRLDTILADTRHRLRAEVDRQEAEYYAGIAVLQSKFRALCSAETASLESLRTGAEAATRGCNVVEGAAQESLLAHSLAKDVRNLREFVFLPALEEFASSIAERRSSGLTTLQGGHGPLPGVLLTPGLANPLLGIDEVDIAGVRSHLRALRVSQHHMLDRGQLPTGERELLLVYDTQEQQYRLADFSAGGVVAGDGLAAPREDRIEPDWASRRHLTFTVMVGGRPVSLQLSELS